MTRPIDRLGDISRRGVVPAMGGALVSRAAISSWAGDVFAQSPSIRSPTHHSQAAGIGRLMSFDPNR